MPPATRGLVVVVTTMRCERIAPLVRVRLLSRQIEREVRRKAPGYIWSRTSLSLKRRQLVSVSLWVDVPSIQAMGSVGSHIGAAHYVVRAGVTTDSGVFTFQGHWSSAVYGIDRRADQARTMRGLAI